jgi:hypothetical protein
MAAYYNENDPHAAEWLRGLISNGSLPPGEVDERDIEKVRASDIHGYEQVHWFAGFGGWAKAFRVAGWGDGRPAWTGSCPCQPFSRAGKKLGFADPRHLWPVWRDLIAECRPAVIFGEQSAQASEWLRSVRCDLEQLEYAVGAVPMEAASAGSFHRRDRYWFVADRDDKQREREREQSGNESELGKSLDVGYAEGDHEWRARQSGRAGEIPLGGSGAGGRLEWVIDKFGKSRPIEPGVCGVAHGLSGGRMVVSGAVEGGEEPHTYNRARALKGFGNAVDLRAATAFVKACMNILVPMCGWIISTTFLIAATSNGR